MILALLIIKISLDIIAPIVIIFVSWPYSQKAREKYPLLKLPDGKKHIIIIVVAFLIILSHALGWWTGTNPATRSDLQETAETIQQGNDKQWSQVLSATIRAKWPLEGSWDLDNFSLVDQKIRIVILADQAMWYQSNGGDYASYQKLLSLRGQNNLPQLFVEDQLQRVNSVLRLANSTVSRIPLCKNNKNIGNRCIEVETEDNFEVNNVVAQLSHPLYWVSRAKSAYLLHFLTPEMIQKSSVSWETVLDALYAAFSGLNETHKNNNLLIRYMAWESFRKLTCFADNNELFDIQKAKAWWENKKNRKKVLNALKNGQKSHQLINYCTVNNIPTGRHAETDE